MDKLTDCRNEVRRLIKETTYCGFDKKHTLMVATYGKFAEFEKLLSKLILLLIMLAVDKQDKTPDDTS